jgi:hypothetical protein
MKAVTLVIAVALLGTGRSRLPGKSFDLSSRHARSSQR